MNRLVSQKSPYLLQHADNPVDWYPWGEEAFEAARRLDKPVFLSIGYSTCHWCHVMEKESFADDTVAALLNDAFICIKVDREERPDLDDHFMTVSRLLTGTGGWPLTVILTPQAQAFYSATYIPRENAYGRPGMLDLVPRLVDVWKNRREEVTESAGTIAAELSRLSRVTDAGFTPSPEVAVTAARVLSASFDSRFGGFGGAPKFPMPTLFTLLLRAGERDGDEETLGMVERTLAAMRAGGIYDQVGFGFHRYSTDERWLVPHFEKMLYDQALHVLAYTEAWQATGREQWRRTAREVCEYVLRDLSLPEGGFATAEDADSEGEEGRFYLWTEDEIRGVLGERAADFLSRYELSEGILHGRAGEPAAPGGDERALLSVRLRRTRPLRDDKLLVDWNGLMIAALARAGACFSDAPLVQAAEKAARFILRVMRRENDGVLLHRYRDGESVIEAFADDYAFLAWGCLELYEATFDAHWLEESLRLIAELRERFWDEAAGGLFGTAPGAEGMRRKSYTDGVIPSANAVAALVAMKLHRLTGRAALRSIAEQVLSSSPEAAGTEPLSFSFLLCAADFAAGPTQEVVIAGEAGSPDTNEMLEALRRAHCPNATLVLRVPGPAGAEIARLAPFTAELEPVGGRATAYVCQDFACSLPTTDPAVMIRQVTGRLPPPRPSGGTGRP
ncbi:MAG TPA: thioredoxin domain-containing protein [Spirochaetia bacterium]|nr:thioredoxin domain-containing protein [Spirochaetia bacterium]